MKKFIIAFIALISISSAANIQAAEVQPTATQQQQEVQTTGVTVTDQKIMEAGYDVQTGGTQTFNQVDYNGEHSTITITQDPVTAGLSDMASRTYTVTKTGWNWFVSYKIKISKNKITSAYNKHTETVRGQFWYSGLSKRSSKKAKWVGLYHRSMFLIPVSCTATMKGTKLSVR